MTSGKSGQVRRVCLAAWMAGILTILAPGVLYAQSAIVGTVKDTSGAVLPGVTVEAASDVLIEKVKSATTDGDGSFRIPDLRPGTYTVTFTMPGFNTYRREVRIAAEFTATINADLAVGSLEETVTVTGASPVVDVTTATRTQTMDRESIDAIPTGRSIQGMAQLVVGINLSLPDTGGARAMQQTYMNTRGMTASNVTTLVDGMMVNGLQADGAIQSYFNDAMNQEVSYQTAGIGAETSAGGIRLNMIPREGGNRFNGDFKMAYRPGAWQSSNLTDRHMARGLNAGNATDRIVDYTFALGGPIKKDTLWFFTSLRYYSVNNYIANTFFDDGSQGVDDQFIKSGLARLTWQISPRNKISGYFDEIDKFRGHDMQSNVDPETASWRWFSPAYHTTAVKWTSPVTSQLLLEAGWSSNLEYYTNSYQEGVEEPRGTAAWYAKASRNDLDLGYINVAPTSHLTESPARYAVSGTGTYVTGPHTFKAGMQMTWGSYTHSRDANADLVQQYRSSTTGIPFTVPDSVLIRNTPLLYGERLNYDLGFFVQDSWTINRLTVNAGVRYEKIKAQVLAAESPAGRFVPARRFDAIQDLPNWSDWAPRLAVVYDLFGNGKTAVKASVNRYNLARTTGIASAYNPLLSQTATLQWRDVNGDDIAQGERGCTGYPAVGCEINFAALASNFGTAALAEYGQFPRTWNLETGVELEQELRPNLSVSGAWYQGSFQNLTVSINQSWTLADYTPYTLYNPVSGEPFTAYARSQAAQGRPIRNLDTFDPERKRQYDSFAFQFRARPGGGSQIFGGVSVERQRDAFCTAPDDPNKVSGTAGVYNTDLWCDDFAHGQTPYRKNYKLAGSLPPFWGFTVSAAFQSNEPLTASRRMTATRGTTRYPADCPSPCPAGQVILPSTVFYQPTLTFNIEPESSVFVERITQLDFKVTRTFRYGRISVIPTFEVFNINNSDAIISYVTTNALSTSYLAPNSIMQGRLYGVGAMVRW
jgi:Carboxypeptidase regulatory-like domain